MCATVSGTAARGAGPQDGECHRAGKPGAARLGRLLQAQPEQASTGRAGWLGQAQTSLCHLAAWKQPSTRARNLMRLGLSEERACKSAFNGRGPWWNSGAPHVNQALPKKLWDRLDWSRYWIRSIGLTAWPEPPCTEPYARWCGRTAAVRPPPTRSRGKQSEQLLFMDGDFGPLLGDLDRRRLRQQ